MKLIDFLPRHIFSGNKLSLLWFLENMKQHFCLVSFVLTIKTLVVNNFLILFILSIKILVLFSK